MRIIYEEGFAVHKDVEAVINSANNYLVFGSGGAGEIRESSEKLTIFGMISFYFHLYQLSLHIRRWILNGYKNHADWTYTEISLSSIKKLLKNKSKPFDYGTAILSDIKVKNKYIINAIGTGFNVSKKSEETRTGSSKERIEKSVFSSLEIAKSLGCKSVAIPIMCARKKYWIGYRSILCSYYE